MKPIFNDPLHDRVGTWPLGYIPYGGADYGEVVAVADAIGDGDDAAFHRTLQAAGNRLTAEAEGALAKGHRVSSRELLLRAACCHGKSFHPLFGRPVDQRVLLGHRTQIALFEKALALGPDPVSPMRIPFETTTLPAYLTRLKAVPTKCGRR